MTYFQVSSVTNAMRAKTLLARRGIVAYVSRQTGDEDNGCGYSVAVSGRGGEADFAEQVLADAGVRVRGKRTRDDL
ncbi:MAG: DUF3343 domain-containing protein [Oscillospiraceae bacterium]|nr:DUF3343 domain-containing protein [Oscillospiraceae bacterium]